MPCAGADARDRADAREGRGGAMVGNASAAASPVSGVACGTCSFDDELAERGDAPRRARFICFRPLASGSMSEAGRLSDFFAATFSVPEDPCGFNGGSVCCVAQRRRTSGHPSSAERGSHVQSSSGQPFHFTKYSTLRPRWRCARMASTS
jgi:hypothetical protein